MIHHVVAATVVVAHLPLVFYKFAPGIGRVIAPLI